MNTATMQDLRVPDCVRCAAYAKRKARHHVWDARRRRDVSVCDDCLTTMERALPEKESGVLWR